MTMIQVFSVSVVLTLLSLGVGFAIDYYNAWWRQVNKEIIENNFMKLPEGQGYFFKGYHKIYLFFGIIFWVSFATVVISSIVLIINAFSN